MMESNQAKKIIIIAAPSGAGKTSIVKYLLQKFSSQIAFSISATTRKPRHNETDGVDYYFFSVDSFKKKIEQNEFIEWEMVYTDLYYGTLFEELKRIWQMQKLPLLEVDVQGAVAIQRLFPDTSLSIFIEPPSLEELKNRLKNRGTETAESLAKRISKADFEMTFSNQFDKIIINHNLEDAQLEAEKIVAEFLQL